MLNAPDEQTRLFATCPLSYDSKFRCLFRSALRIFDIVRCFSSWGALPRPGAYRCTPAPRCASGGHRIGSEDVKPGYDRFAGVKKRERNSRSPNTRPISLNEKNGISPIKKIITI